MPELKPVSTEPEAPAAEVATDLGEEKAPSLWSPAASPKPAAAGSVSPATVGTDVVPPDAPAPTRSAWFDRRSPEPVAPVDAATPAWCRACGATSEGSGATCDRCGWALAVAEVAPSYVGLVFAVPGKLLVNKKRGVCIAADDQALQLHFSLDDSQVVPLVGAPNYDEGLSRPDLSPAARLQHAARQAQAGQVKASWDPSVLVQAAVSWANVSIAAMRTLADESLTLGWTDVFDWTGLTAPEKSWRQAHHAAKVGASERLIGRLGELPAAGYPERWRLCLPFLAEIVARPDEWRPIVNAALAAASNEAPRMGLEVLTTALAGDAQDGLRQFGEVLAGRGYDERGKYWQDVADRVASGTPGPPPDRPHPAWAALSQYLIRSEPLTTDHAFSLSPALLDDVIDTGSLAASTTFEHLDLDDRRYLEARLRPGTLGSDKLKREGHHDELARRAFLAGDRPRLDELPESEAVEYYRQLFQLALGQPVELSRVRSVARPAIEAVIQVLATDREDEPIELPPAVVTDPSLWSLFVDRAQRGGIDITEAQRARAPRFADWVALHELVGLVNAGSYDAALEAGRSLMASTGVSERRGEAASLTAAALHRLGRTDEAYGVLEAELSRHYSLGSWFNAAMLADQAKPEAARHYWTHLAGELAPPDAWAALIRAVGAPSLKEDSGWSSELVALVENALTTCDLDTYARVFSVAVIHAPGVIPNSAERGGEFDHVRDLYLNLARAYDASPATKAQSLVSSFTSTSHLRRSEDWFVRELHHTADVMALLLSQEFGQARIPAEVAMGLVESELVDLLRRDQVYRLSAMGYGAYVAGTHAGMDAPSRQRGDGAEVDWPAVSQYEKWIFDPLSDFLEQNRAGQAGRVDEVTEAFSHAIFGVVRARLTVALHLGWQLERITRQELHAGKPPRNEVEAERRSDMEVLVGHQDLARTSLRYLRLLVPDNPAMNSMRIHQVEGNIDELRGLLKRYEGIAG